MKIADTELLIEGGVTNHVGLTEDGAYYYWSFLRIMNLYTTEIDPVDNTLSSRQLIVTENLNQRLNPSWSPKGEKLSYIRLSFDWSTRDVEIKDLIHGNEQILKLDLDPELVLTSNRGEWSKDGTKLLLLVRNTTVEPGTFYFNSAFEIIIADIKSGKCKTIAQNGEFPVLGKDEMIYFVRNRTIVEKHYESGIEKVIYTSDQDNIYSLSSSPDGNQLAFLRGPMIK